MWKSYFWKTSGGLGLAESAPRLAEAKRSWHGVTANSPSSRRQFIINVRGHWTQPARFPFLFISRVDTKFGISLGFFAAWICQSWCENSLQLSEVEVGWWGLNFSAALRRLERKMKGVIKAKSFYLVVNITGIVWALENKSDCFMKSKLTERRLFLNIKRSRNCFVDV